MANTHAQARAIGEMKAGTRRKKVPAHWWDIVVSQQAIARFDQATPTDEHTWRLVPKVQAVVKPKAEQLLHRPPPPPAPPPGVSDSATYGSLPHAPAKPAPVATPPKATAAKAPAVQALPPKAPSVGYERPQVPRKLDPRLPTMGAVQTFTHPKSGTVYTWKVIDNKGRVSMSGGTLAGQEFSSVSSAAAHINNGTSTNGYMFFGLGKKA